MMLKPNAVAAHFNVPSTCKLQDQLVDALHAQWPEPDPQAGPRR
jgi:hypothetical protein